MPTAFTHVIAGFALAQGSDDRWGSTWKFWAISAFCAVLPDLDALGLYWGIPYASVWGHRGFLHSLTFALIAGVLLSFLVDCPMRRRWKPALILSCIVASHDLLDALTNGGLGIALFSPFDLHRYFFPWRPIKVSPIGMRFFSPRGLAVLISESKIVWLPALLLGLLLRFIRPGSGLADAEAQPNR